MKKVLIMLMLVSLPFGASGCLIEHRDIDKLDFVLGAVFDYDAQNQMYEVHIQIAKPAAFSKGQAVQETETFLIYSGRGETIFEAIRDVAKNTNKRLFWAHCDVYIVGEELARRGMFELLDFIIRDNETRASARIFVNTVPIDQFITLKNGTEKVPLSALKRMAVLGPQSHGTTFDKKIIECWKHLSRENCFFLVPLVGVREPDVKSKEAHRKFHLTGAAVYERDRMIGNLTPEETRGYLFIENKIQDTVIPAYVRGRRVTFELIGSKAKIKPYIENGNISFLVEIRPSINFGEIDQRVNLEDQDFIKESENVFNQELQKEVVSSIAKAQQLQADYFNLGREVQLAEPKLWEEIKGDWAKKIFPDIVIDVKVKSTLLRTGLLISTEPGVRR